MALVQISTLLVLAAFQIGFIDTSPPGYTYIPSTRASYKYHDDYAKWPAAKNTCRSEGGVMFHPDTETELITVFRVLNIYTRYYLHTGLSDLAEPKVYRTVDGRPLSRVFMKWQDRQPDFGSRAGGRCVILDFGQRRYSVDSCELTLPYICKALVDHVVTAVEDVRVAVANFSDKQTLILDRLAEAAANQASALDRMSVNLAAVLERISKTDANQAAALDRVTTNQAVAMQQITAAIGLQAANQTSATDKLMTSVASAMQQLTAAIGLQTANQTATLDRLMTSMTAAMQQLTAAIGLQAKNQTTAMERQALALEKMASQEEKSQLDIRSE